MEDNKNSNKFLEPRNHDDFFGSFEMLRSERRSFFCPNKLWKELLEQTDDCISISSYVKMAILEKMIRDEPDKKDYFEELME